MSHAPALPHHHLIIDNDILTHWRNSTDYVLRAIDAYLGVHKGPPALAAITVFETFLGFEKAEARGRTKDEVAPYRAAAEALLSQTQIIPFDKGAALIAARVFGRLPRGDRQKHWKDIFVAATAYPAGYGVATGNRRDFEMIASHLPTDDEPLRLATWKP